MNFNVIIKIQTRI